jgi:hypothetical protein
MESPHASRQPNGYVAVIVTFAAGATTLFLRLIARRLTRVQLWWDDYIAVVAFLSAGVWSAFVLWCKCIAVGIKIYLLIRVGLDVGLGKHLQDIQMPQARVLETSRLILFHAELAYAFSLAWAKLAILAFYWRMFKTSSIRIPIQVLTACTLVWLVLRVYLTIIGDGQRLTSVCRLSLLYSIAFPSKSSGKQILTAFATLMVRPDIRLLTSDVLLIVSRNLVDSKFFFGTVLTHLLIDIVILALPVIEVQKLQLPLSQRLGIIGMFMFGIFVCVASVVVLVFSINYDAKSVDMPWNIAPIIIWASVEVNLAIVSGRFMVLKQNISSS